MTTGRVYHLIAGEWVRSLDTLPEPPDPDLAVEDDGDEIDIDPDDWDDDDEDWDDEDDLDDDPEDDDGWDDEEWDDEIEDRDHLFNCVR
jgi:hypothetical protein